MALHSINIFEI